LIPLRAVNIAPRGRFIFNTQVAYGAFHVPGSAEERLSKPSTFSKFLFAFFAAKSPNPAMSFEARDSMPSASTV
jgi:hypothetical protein